MVDASRDEGRTWDRFAKRYDLTAGVFGRSYPAVRAALARDLAGRRRALELAAGTGQFTEALARTVETLVATDVSAAMTARLRAAVEARGLANVTVRTMSAYAIDADDASFDAVFCANALHVMERPADALAEMRRVLAPGGLLVTPTFLHGAGRGPRLLSRAMSLVSPFVAHTRFDRAGLLAAIEAAGMERVRDEVFPGLFPIGYVVSRRAP